MRWHWIDIEDDAELLGEVDVETFPTLIVVAPDAVRFAGPLLPHADTLRRVLRACLDDVASGAQGPVLDGATRDFALRLLARPVDPTG